MRRAIAGGSASSRWERPAGSEASSRFPSWSRRFAAPSTAILLMEPGPRGTDPLNAYKDLVGEEWLALGGAAANRAHGCGRLRSRSFSHLMVKGMIRISP